MPSRKSASRSSPPAPGARWDAELTCTDTSGLSADEVSARNTLAYVDKSAEAAKNCANCMQFNAGPADKCGGCKVLKGPIAPTGYCKVWVAKT